jgi:hypothetical protein
MGDESGAEISAPLFISAVRVGGSHFAMLPILDI